MAIEFSTQDMLRGKILSPDWYTLIIDKIEERLSKDGGSTNIWFEATVIKNASTGSTEFEGVPLRWCMNSKFSSTIMAFLKLFGVEPELGKKYTFAFAEGKQVDYFVQNKMFENRVINEITNQFRLPR